MVTEEIKKDAQDISLGDILTIGSRPYEVEGIEYDGDDEYTFNLKYVNKQYVTPDDFIDLKVNSRHVLRVQPKTT